jgi:phosphoribosylformylglycinamidine synthase
VSFYNESLGADIDPTPVVAVLGLVDDLRARPPTPRLTEGDRIVVLGVTGAELGGSEWADVVHDLDGGPAPRADLDAARALHVLVVELVNAGRLGGVHDCSDGGLAVTLAEMAFGGSADKCGFSVDIELVPHAEPLTPAEACFSESTSRVVLAVPSREIAGVMSAAAAAGVAAADIGEAGGDRLRADDAFDVALGEAHRAWSNGLPAALGLDVTAGSAPLSG